MKPGDRSLIVDLGLADEHRAEAVTDERWAVLGPLLTVALSRGVDLGWVVCHPRRRAQIHDGGSGGSRLPLSVGMAAWAQTPSLA